MALATSSSTSKNMIPKYFEEYGLRIPLVKRGQRVPHARLASELAMGSKEKLSAIVQNFLQAVSKATKLIKTLHSKSAIAEWIESAETLALGPHPESKLFSTKKEDLVKALGLKTTASKVKATRAKKDISSKKRPDQKQATSPTNNQAVAQSVVSSPSRAERQSAAVQRKTSSSSQSEPQQMLSLTTDLTLELPRTAVEPANITHDANKRKCDNSAETSPVEQTRKKKTKTYQAVSPPTILLPPMGDTVDSRAPVLAQQISPSISSSKRASHGQDDPPNSTCHTQVDEQASRDTSLLGIDLNLKNEYISVVIPLSAQNIVVTHASLMTYAPEIDWKKQRTGRYETLDGGRTYNKKQSKIAYCIFIPHDYDGDACQLREADKLPFLKPGRHGRHGDFIGDPDLLTGQGHQVEPADSKRRRAYEVEYRAFYTTTPSYPYADEMRESLLTNHVERRTQLVREERWMKEYRDKYQGENTISGDERDKCNMIPRNSNT
ncbi:hypothetical protein ST47_g6881 [Ascochyta rabiei]|uniref:Uncharacterized protein n=1 Tax=Didymella rabiei TaxID=5454 RepID=A0A163BSV7_DIDRA|nr:hypothetical protein ST47_g6881 [Ascochyta rabiei]